MHAVTHLGVLHQSPVPIRSLVGLTGLGRALAAMETTWMVTAHHVIFAH